MTSVLACTHPAYHVGIWKTTPTNFMKHLQGMHALNIVCAHQLGIIGHYQQASALAYSNGINISKILEWRGRISWATLFVD